MVGRRDPIASWHQALREGWGDDPRPEVLDAITEPVAALLDAQAEPEEVFTALGRAAGAGGYPVDDAAGWAQALLDALPRRSASRWDRHDLATCVVTGWAEGTLGRPPVELESSLSLLVLRLGELYDRCAAVGLDPVVTFAIVVVDVRSAADHEAAETRARAALSEGLGPLEVVAAARPGRLLAVVSRTDDLASRVRGLADGLDSNGDGPARAWIEPLGAERDHLASHLAALAL